jgi:DNA repair exonuclease SbcCD ATPase subunit
MIDAVHLQNFQSHSDTLLKLHPGINTISGDSDKGKSAAIRGLLWAVENNPQGDAHVSDWIKTEKGTIKAKAECKVTVFSGKGSLSRIRSGTLNGYEVNGKILEAIRTDVPAEVGDFFGLGEVNIQRQMDRPFLISYPSGEAARFLNRLVNLTDIDVAMTSMESKRRGLRKEVADIGASIEIVSGKLGKLGWVDRALILLKEAREIQAKKDALRARVDFATSTLAQYAGHQAEVQALGATCVKATALLASAEKLRDAIRGVSNQVNGVTLQLKQFKMVSAELVLLAPACSAASVKIGEASGLVAPMTALRSSIALASGGLAQFAEAQAMVKKAPCIGKAAGKLSEAEALKEKIRPLQLLVASVEASLSEWEFLHKATPSAEGLEIASRKIDRALRAHSALTALREAVGLTTQQLADFRWAETEATDAKAAASSIQAKMSVCPTCGQTWPEGHVHV